MTHEDGEREHCMSAVRPIRDPVDPVGRGFAGGRRRDSRGMDMEPVPGLTVRVLGTGWMELGHPELDDRLLCDEVGTAMWIALCRSAWNLGDAAAHLADLWDADPWSMRDMMDDWLSDLQEAGLVRR
jgi:hypothetical protein